MATYPTLSTSYGSDLKPVNGISVDRAEDGTARVRSFHVSDKGTFPVAHPWLSAANKSTLDAFYAANRLLPFDYTSPTDSVLRVCVFAAPIRYTRKPGEFWDAVVEMELV